MPTLTMKDIAKAVGVSEMTVSRAFQDGAGISKATRTKVKAKALELGYVPNQIAGALSSNKVNLVGVVIPSVKSYVFSEVLDGISQGLHQSNLRPVFGLSNYDLETEAEVIRDMLAWRPAGLIIAGLEHSDAARRMLQETDTPIVEMMDVDGSAIDSCVGISHYQAGYDMAKAIVQRGYQQIGFLGTKMSSDFRASKRLKGFVAGLETHNLCLADQELYNAGSSVQKGKEFTHQLLQRSPKLDCIYCSTDVLAVGVVMHCLDVGLKIPEDLAVAGFNQLDMAQGLPVNLATTDSLRYAIGCKAAEIVLQSHQKTTDKPLKQRRVLETSPYMGNSI